MKTVNYAFRLKLIFWICGPLCILFVFLVLYANYEVARENELANAKANEILARDAAEKEQNQKIETYIQSLLAEEKTSGGGENKLFLKKEVSSSEVESSIGPADIIVDEAEYEEWIYLNWGNSGDEMTLGETVRGELGPGTYPLPLKKVTPTGTRFGPVQYKHQKEEADGITTVTTPVLYNTKVAFWFLFSNRTRKGWDPLTGKDIVSIKGHLEEVTLGNCAISAIYHSCNPMGVPSVEKDGTIHWGRGSHPSYSIVR